MNRRVHPLECIMGNQIIHDALKRVNSSCPGKMEKLNQIKSTLYRLLLKIFSSSTCNYADQIKPLIQRTPTGRLSTVACFKTQDGENFEGLREVQKDEK